MLTVSNCRCFILSYFKRCIVGIGIFSAVAGLVAQRPNANTAAAQFAATDSAVADDPYPGLGPWRRTRDGWQILDSRLRKAVRSPVTRPLMNLHPMVGATFMALLAVFALIAFERDHRS